MTPARRKPTSEQRRRDAAILAWVEHTMGDPVPARPAQRVIGMHAALIRWIQEAEQSTLTPAPQRRHPFDDRDATRGARITGTRDPDTWMIHSKAKHPNCMYLWMNHMASAEANGQATVWFGEAPTSRVPARQGDPGSGSLPPRRRWHWGRAMGRS